MLLAVYNLCKKYGSEFMCHIQNKKRQREREREQISGCRAWLGDRGTTDGFRVPFSSVENVLERDSGECPHTLCMYEMPPKRAL